VTTLLTEVAREQERLRKQRAVEQMEYEKM
jgi:hypothetical protein